MRALDRLDSRIDSLDPDLRRVTLRFVALAADQGIPLRVTSTGRTFGAQRALFAQGRQPRYYVNELRQAAGLPPIGPRENLRKVTNAQPGHSFHNFGLAFDVVPMTLAARLLPDWASPHWKKLGEIGDALGLEWGGNWSKPDRPHFQWRRAELAELREKYPEGPPAFV